MNEQIVNLGNIDANAKVKILRGLIQQIDSKIFYVYFKKLDGSLREMLCRRHVKKGVKGTIKYDVESVDRMHDQITVFDMTKEEFRKINLNKVEEFKCEGIRYLFTDDLEQTNFIDIQDLASKNPDATFNIAFSTVKGDIIL